ncbi:MAG: putative transcriptional regulator [Herbinix sp.]|jgi:transcriptional regulator with XRE-family HTH domain|nr:putative transcriptional regulator [Herbinix sp.]
MIIKIGEKIRELRKKADVNQEKFAEYLGITAQAVSKWEVEGCYPDIELLPSIANFFNISIDELMCFDIMKNQEKIDMIIKQAGPERSKNWFDGTKIEMFRNAVQEFPNNYDLLYCLAKTLCFTKKPEEEKQKNLREAISICTRILSDCTDDNLRFRSLQVLAHAYKEIGEKEKAVETANRLPLARDSRDMVLPEILDGEARSNHIVQNIWLLSDMFEYLIENLANSKYKDNSEKRVELFKKLVSIEEILHEDSDYIYETLRLRAVYYWLSEDYIKLNDYDNALDCIEQFAEYSIKFDTLPEVSTYTSVIFQGQTCSKYKDLDIKTTASGSKEYLVSREIFAPVREHIRFRDVITELEKHIK